MGKLAMVKLPSGCQHPRWEIDSQIICPLGVLGVMKELKLGELEVLSG